MSLRGVCLSSSAYWGLACSRVTAIVFRSFAIWGSSQLASGVAGFSPVACQLQTVETGRLGIFFYLGRPQRAAAASGQQTNIKPS